MPRAAFTASFRNHFQPLESVLAALAPVQSAGNVHDVFARVSELLDAWGERFSDLDSRPQHAAGLWSNTPADTGPAAQAAMFSLSSGIAATKPDDHPEGFDKLSPTEAPELDPLEAASAAAPRPGVVETVDAADNAGTAYTLLAGQTAQGTIGFNGDRDFYAVTLQAGQTYSFALVGTGINNVIDPYLRLMDQSGTFELAFNDDGLPNNNSVFTYTPGSTGTYYVSAGSFDDIGTGQYGVTVTEGARPSFDIPMGAGAIDADRTWAAAPGTGVVVTYAFRATPAGYTVSGSNIASFTPLTATEIAAVRAALQAWSDLSGITFVEVNPGGYSDNATMLFANYTDATDGAGAFAFYPGSTASTASAGDVWLNTTSIPTGSVIQPGSYAYSAIMHEIGHAIGLSHPGSYNAGPGQTITYANNAQFTEDSDQYSLMSYFDEANTGAQFFGHPESPMLFDVYAVQQIYGANAATRAGNTIYGYNSNAGGIYDFATNTIAAFTIWDGGGIDTIDASGSTADATIDLNEGRFSSINSAISNVAIAIGVTIENAIGGSGNDTITGNGVGNLLEGRGGIDNIQGGDGDDTIEGGAGGDAINGGGGANDIAAYGSSAAVSIDLFTGAISGGDAAGDSLSGIEGLSGSAFNDSLWGTGGANRLYGQSGNDILDGRTGNDQLFGGDGGDWLEGGGGADAIDGGTGDDVAAYGASAVAVSVDLQTGAVSGGDAVGDTFVAVESLSGSPFNDSFWGDGNANRLYGRNGNDILDGRNGNDQLFGGDGHDWLEGGAGGDLLDGGTGDDTAAYGSSAAAVSVDLQTGAVSGGNAVGDTLTAIESLSGSPFNDSLWGNAGANRIYGRNGNDILDGRAGNDQLFGGDGIDWLEGGAGADIVDGGLGDDTAAFGSSTAAVSVDLQAGTVSGGYAAGDTLIGIESLSGSAFNDALSGDGIANRIYGRNGDDTLAGRAGNDTLEGGNNNDTFVFADNGGADRINDFDDFGDDVIQLSIAGITDFAAVQALMTQSGADVLIDFATTDIILVNTSLAAMGTDDFTFV